MHDRFDALDQGKVLELSGSAMSRLISLATKRIKHFLNTLDSAPHGPGPDAVEKARSVSESLPVVGTPPEQLFETLFEDLLPASINTASPTYFGYIPGGGLPHAAVADLISDILNRYIGVWSAAPPFAQIETTVVRWLCDIVGFPPSAGGFLTGGGSLANWSAIVTALHCKLSEDFAEGLVYASDQTHHSIHRAAALAGLPKDSVRSIPSDDQFRIDLDELAKTIQRDQRKGLKPVVLIGNAGTTNTGAVDDLDALVKIARTHNLWLHIDAAYGGFFAMTRHGQRILKSLNHADSLTLDPHKGMFLPYGTGSLLVKDVDNLRRVHHQSAPYLPESDPDREFEDLADISPELTREFRGLRIWLPLKMHGIEPFRTNLEEKLDLARWLADELKNCPGIQIVSEPQLSTVTFRFSAPGLDDRELNELNKRGLKQINDRGRVYLTPTTVREPTTLRDRFMVRVCILSFRTHRKHVEQCLDEIRLAAASTMQVAHPCEQC